MKRGKVVRRLLWFFLFCFILMNGVAFMHAYKFTHFSAPEKELPKQQSLSTLGKLNLLITGINNPRPESDNKPSRPYQTIKLKSNKMIECWMIKADHPMGTVILFHGYGGEKTDMLDKANEFLNLGYSTLLVDFMGSGGSEGNQTTIGYKEAEEVKTSYDYISGQKEKNIVLFGTSMGAAAVMKAMKDYELKPAALILECPYSTLYQAVCNRFQNMHVPTFPMAGLLVFWGGIQNNFWAFSLNPSDYAKSITCPTLLLYGGSDQKVKRKEIEEIYANLQGPKKLTTFPLAGHEDYLLKYKKEWVDVVKAYLDEHCTKMEEPKQVGALMAEN